jgi:hypothetical protein
MNPRWWAHVPTGFVARENGCRGLNQARPASSPGARSDPWLRGARGASLPLYLGRLRPPSTLRIRIPNTSVTEVRVLCCAAARPSRRPSVDSDGVDSAGAHRPGGPVRVHGGLGGHGAPPPHPNPTMIAWGLQCSVQRPHRTFARSISTACPEVVVPASDRAPGPFPIGLANTRGTRSSVRGACGEPVVCGRVRSSLTP